MVFGGWLSLVAGVVFCIASHAQVVRYDPATVRPMLFQLRDHHPAVHLHLVGRYPPRAARPFLEYFADEILPELNRIQALDERASALYLLMDSGSQQDQAEFDAWFKEFNELEQQSNLITVDPAWTNQLRYWAELATGLKGELPDVAHEAYAHRQRVLFAPEQKGRLDEEAALMSHIQKTMREVPANKDLRVFYGTQTDTVARFQKGELTFQQAHQIILDNASTRGPHFVGQQLLAAAGASLNRLAVVRTELAKAKGKATWAEYKMEADGQGYDPAYRDPKKQLAFLTKLLADFKVLQDRLIDRRLEQLGLARQDIVAEDLSLLRQEGFLALKPFFPAAEITNVWEKTLNESGFEPHTLSQVIVDDTFRDKKNANGAYQMAARRPSTTELTVDTSSLSIVKTPSTQPGFVYILQSYVDRGLMDLRTAFHEGGHATDSLLEGSNQNILSLIQPRQAYGAVEVPSMSSERFLRDPEILMARAVPVNGQKPTREQIQKALQQQQINDVDQGPHIAEGAYVDMALWDYDYTAPGAETFEQRIKTVHDQLEPLGPQLAHAALPTPLYLYAAGIPHFMSGNVRYLGYVYAEMASTMMARYFSERLEEETGRGSWHQQPGFASIYAGEFVSQAGKMKFPGSIETITGRAFDPEVWLSEHRATTDRTCQALLNPAGNQTAVGP